MSNNARDTREQVTNDKNLSSKKIVKIKDFFENKYRCTKSIKNIENRGP